VVQEIYKGRKTLKRKRTESSTRKEKKLTKSHQIVIKEFHIKKLLTPLGNKKTIGSSREKPKKGEKREEKKRKTRV